MASRQYFVIARAPEHQALTAESVRRLLWREYPKSEWEVREVDSHELPALRADNARLTAEVERLKSDVLNERRQAREWETSFRAADAAHDNSEAEIAALRALCGRAANAMAWTDPCPKDAKELAALITATREAATKGA